MFPLPGSLAKKSVIAKTLAILPDLDAMLVIVDPRTAADAPLALETMDNLLSLLVILMAALLGTPYCVNTSTTLPVKVSGSFNLFSS
jgi:hypothetical protein